MLTDYLFQTATLYRRSPYIFQAQSFVGTTTVDVSLDSPARLSCTVEATQPVTLTVVGSTTETLNFSSRTHLLGTKMFSTVSSISVVGATANLVEIRSVDSAGNQVGLWQRLGNYNVRLTKATTVGLSDLGAGEVFAERNKLVFIINSGIKAGDVLVIGEDKLKVTSVDHLYTKQSYHHSECSVEETEEKIPI